MRPYTDEGVREAVRILREGKDHWGESDSSFVQRIAAALGASEEASAPVAWVVALREEGVPGGIYRHRETGHIDAYATREQSEEHANADESDDMLVPLYLAPPEAGERIEGWVNIHSLANLRRGDGSATFYREGRPPLWPATTPIRCTLLIRRHEP